MEWIGDQRDATNRESVLICDVPYFGNISAWERHLAVLKTLPDNTMFKAEMIEAAEEMVAWKKGGPQPMPKGMPMGKW